MPADRAMVVCRVRECSANPGACYGQGQGHKREQARAAFADNRNVRLDPPLHAHTDVHPPCVTCCCCCLTAWPAPSAPALGCPPPPQVYVAPYQWSFPLNLPPQVGHAPPCTQRNAARARCARPLQPLRERLTRGCRCSRCVHVAGMGWGEWDGAGWGGAGSGGGIHAPASVGKGAHPHYPYTPQTLTRRGKCVRACVVYPHPPPARPRSPTVAPTPPATVLLASAPAGDLATT